MPAARQNALIKKYCAVCHSDNAANGGLSLQHFDAASAAPSLAAMLLSKLTGGVPVETVRAVRSNADAAALVDTRVKNGAMGAAGIPVPDKPTVDALVQALAERAGGATKWSVERTAPEIVASTLREVPFGENGDARLYRLKLACNPGTQQGTVQVAWSPVPQRGTLTVSVDGLKTRSYRVDGSEKMGNGSPVVTQGLAAAELTGTGLPAETMTITDLFPGERVEFSFSDLAPEARHDLRACFSR